MVALRNPSALALALALCFTPAAARGGDPPRRVPTVDDLLQFKLLGAARISPDGKRVAYGVTETDFKQDAFLHHLWLADVATGRAVRLTRGPRSAGNPAW